VAVVSGWPAWALARLLTRYCRDEIEDLPLEQRRFVTAAIDSLRLAGEHAIAASGSAPLSSAEIAVGSNHDEELDSDAAADMLKLSARRVRQLAAAGRLPGRLKAGRWSFDADAVTAYRKTGGTR
jgi:hypothetical protein